MKQDMINLKSLFFDLEIKWMNAWKNQDVETASMILADEFTLTSSLSKGELMTKEEWLSNLPKYKCESFEFKRIDLLVYGDASIVKSLFHQRASVNGKNWDGNFLLTDVWINKEQGWQVVSRHSSWLND